MLVTVLVCLCSLQVSTRLYTSSDQSSNSKYSASIQSCQKSIPQSLFPKPIYSYRWDYNRFSHNFTNIWQGIKTLMSQCSHYDCSILIFMALKNSKTGSLPVSEIYSFMTEHFPYFKVSQLLFLYPRLNFTHSGSAVAQAEKKTPNILGNGNLRSYSHIFTGL